MWCKQLIICTLMGILAIDPALGSPFDSVRSILSKREIPDTHILHERQMDHWKHTWQKKGKVKSSVLLPMRIGLRQNNLEEGHELLMERADPNSPKYGKHMTAREVIDLFAPSRDSVEKVRDWLVDEGVNISHITQSANKQWIQFDATAAQVENLLYTDFYYWKHGPTGTENIAAEEYHIPADVQKHIDYITPGIRLRPDPGLIRRLKRREEAKSHPKRLFKAMNNGLEAISPDLNVLPPLNNTMCDSYVTNSCIRAKYDISKGTKSARGNELGVFETLADHYSKTDLDVYWSTLYPDIPNGTYPIEENIDGAFGASTWVSTAGIESALDLEVSQPLIWPQRTILFQTDDEFYERNQTSPNTPIRGFWNNFFDAIDGSYCTSSAYGETGNCITPECLDPVYPDPNPGGFKGQLQCGVYRPTNVISISYGGGEADTPDYYAKRQCLEILKLALQGTTVVVAAGDYGVGSFPGDPNPSGCVGAGRNVFYPSSAATCPYVLAVGATQLNKTASTANSSTPVFYESPTQRYPSGGGFSNYFSTPFYQVMQVASYFDKVSLGFSGYFDPGLNFSSVGTGVYKIGGRGYPDVAAIGDYFVVRARGSWGRIGGTSMATPIWAAILTRINEERLAIGKTTIGFVNPTLYAHPEAFTDITTGSNPNCKSTGFLATEGWDPVSGLGTPIYPILLDTFQNLP